jgi:uncharacterized protein involved in exopolysaccharide biosynthesis
VEQDRKLEGTGGRGEGHYVIPIPDRFDEPKIDYGAISSIFYRQRVVVLLSLLLCIVISLSLLAVLPKKYEASMLLASVVEGREPSGLSALASQFGGLASMAGINLGESDSTAEAVAILSSRDLVAKFIEDKDLMPQIFPDLWDEAQGEWAVTGNDVPSMWDAVDYFVKKVRKVNMRKDDGLIQLSITWKDPEVAATWAAELVGLANQVMREDAIHEANESLAYLEERLAKTSSIDVQQGIYRLTENYLRQIMLANVRDEYAFKTIDGATAPDLDDYASPNALLIVLAGLFSGVMLSMVAALWRDRKVRGVRPKGSDDQA